MHKSFEVLPSEDAPVLISLISLYFLPLFGLIDHDLHNWILRVVDLFEHLMSPKVIHMPFMQLQHISDAVNPSVGFQQEGILGQEAGVDDPPPIILGLEVRIGEADEDLLQALLGEVLAKMPHGVGPHHSNVVELPWVLDAISSYLLCHKVHHLVSDLHSQDQLVGEQRRQSEQETSIAASDVDNRYIVAIHRIVPGLFVEGRVLNSIAVSSMIFFLAALEEGGEMRLPINKGMMRRIRKRRAVERINMRPHPIILLLGDQPLSLDHLPIALIIIRLLTGPAFPLHKRNIIIRINFSIQNWRCVLVVLNILTSIMQLGENWSAMLFGLAETSLYERELGKKLQAETELTNAIFRMPLGQFDSLLENAQEVVVLAVAAILLKNVGKLKDHIEGLLTTINEILKRWYQPDGVLKRSKDELRGHIENTFGQFMGNCLKLLVYKDENKEFINRFLDTMTGNPNYRLYLYFRFIESVTTIDTAISYVTYRTLLNNFQSTFLPKIFQALYPYFMNISDSMDINELSSLQNSMSVGEGKMQGCVLEFNGTKFTEIVFTLLEHVMTFKFNISPREYEALEENQTGMMSFPDALLATILRGNFLDALYNVLIHLMKTKEFKYQLVCLGCLKKILLAKTTYIQLALRDHFILKNMEGVFKLLKLIVSSNSVSHRLNAVCILQCNSNFISTFGLDTKLLRGSNSIGYLNQWLELTRTVPLFLLQNDADPIAIDNQLFLAGVTMTVNLANQLRLNNISTGREVYYSSYQAYTREFLNKFIVRGQDILGTTAAKQFTFEGFIKTANDLLGGVKLIFSYNYAQFLGLLNDCCDHLFTGSGGEFSTGNLIILIRELFRQHKFFSESVFGLGLIRSQNGQMQLQGQKAEEVGTFGGILTKTLNFIIRYQSQSVLEYHYLNNCIIIFMSALLEMCTIKTDSHQPQDIRAFFINSQIYLRMKEHLRTDITDQEFLLNCLQTLSQLMHCPQLVNVQYIFQTLLECIERIKWSMRGQYFKYSPIYHEMGKLFTKLSLQAMPPKLIKLRSQLFNIITVLSLDDQLDSYRQNIRNTLELIKGSIVANEWPKILYDITGIFQSMEGPGVFRFFIRNFLKELDFPTLMKQLFTRLAFAEPSHYLRDVLYLSRMMVNNKNRRISASNNNESIYSISRFIIPYWSYCFENAERLDAEEAVVEIYIGAKDLFGQAHVNVCILDNIMAGEFRNFMKLLLLSMFNSIDIIESSGQLSRSLFELAGELIKTVAKALFNLSDEQIGMSFHQFINKLMKKLGVSFNSIVAGAFEERLLEPIIHLIHDYYVFLRDNRKKQHLTNLFRNIARATNDAQDKDLAFQAIVKIAMEFRQHFTATLLQIASICVNLVEFYRIDCKLVVEQLGLSEERDVDELRRIFKHIEEKLEDFEWLSYQMKDWFNMKSRFDNCKITEY